ncbi:MAG: hypothetical protein KJ573_12675 [Proteobacteria bacterium]|nr:hypothetical protein [Desulfobacterales bacterium]MBL6967084.1 hypothetical protein [Desulfobacteraceae bacterium]MBL7171754.1 hypothetical protein [Desulfobacteraceae bacterium]MBU0733551.1 hypothetical protein [Pseudomonadota bacterium]MBU1904430.1 hypothetical protein [Pseudomonadota bacterium]
MDLPFFYRIQQDFDVTAIDDVGGYVARQFHQFDFSSRIQEGQIMWWPSTG